MTENDAYRATLQRLRSDLAQTEARAQKLKAGIAAIEELIDAPEPSSATSVAVVEATPPAVSAPENVARMNMRDAAVSALHLAGRPLRTRQIYDLLMKLGYPYPKGWEKFKGSMTPTLDREKAFFEKVDRGLYALRRWPDAQKAPREAAPSLLDGYFPANGDGR